MKGLSAQPLVSVVLDNYNYGQYLEAAIGSVFSQTYTHFELIVVDDGSTDNSREIAEKFADKAVLVFKENGGQASALNAGVARARGEIVCFLDSDDLWLPEKLQRVVEVFRQSPTIGWVRHKLSVVNSALEPIGTQVPEFQGSDLFRGNKYHYLERRATVSTSALSLRAEVCAAVFPIPGRELYEGAGAGLAKLTLDADAYVTSTMHSAREEGGLQPCQGFSIDEALGLYRRHTGQQFNTTADIVLMIVERQAAVGEVISIAWSRHAGVCRTSLSVHRNRLAALTLRGTPRLAGARLALLVDGCWQGIKMLPSAPGLTLRQLLSLAYVFVFPDRWLRRVFGVQGFSIHPPR
jgi:hypothetical protein